MTHNGIVEPLETSDREKRDVEDQMDCRRRPDSPPQSDLWYYWNIFTTFYGNALQSFRFHVLGLGEYDVESDSDPRVTGNSSNIVLFGQTGTGKSACANTILGKKHFESRVSSVPVTRECQKEYCTLGGTCFTVIDTPDFFDENMATRSKQEMHKCQKLCQSGSCVYLLVMQVGRFTDGERDILNNLQKTFGPKIREKMIILFTRGEDLQFENIELEAFVNGSDPHLQSIVKQCDNRVHVFENNNISDKQQVETLIQKVQTLYQISCQK